MSDRPRIGLLGIMQELYDDMVPGITERQAAYGAEVAAALGAIADVEFIRPARNRQDVEDVTGELLGRGVDGLMIVMLTYGPAMRTVPALLGARVPLLLANIQPERSITADVDDGRPDVQPGDPRRPGPSERARTGGHPVLRPDRRLAIGALCRRVRGLGTRRAQR